MMIWLVVGNGKTPELCGSKIYHRLHPDSGAGNNTRIHGVRVVVEKWKSSDIDGRNRKEHHTRSRIIQQSICDGHGGWD